VVSNLLMTGQYCLEDMSMHVNYKTLVAHAGLVALFLAGSASAGSLNKSINVDAGGTSTGESTVNGSIIIGSGAVITGSVETVNGTIRVEQNARVEDVETVNGSLKIGDGVQSEDLSSVNGSVLVGSYAVVEGEVAVVNGKIALDTGARVSRDVSNVNGEIRVTGAEIGGNLTTVNGDVSLQDQAVLRGDLTIEKPGGWSNNNNKRKPIITIGPGSRVEGEIVIEQEVELYISDTAEVGGVRGEMSLDDAVRFTGSRP